VINVALAGCGAVSQLYYGRALGRLAGQGAIRVDCLFDPDFEAARSMAPQLPRAEVARSFEELLKRSVDLLIVASPPRHHCEQAVAALKAGVAVHCEKPLALTFAEGERMVGEAAGAGRLLSVGMVRRHLRPARAIRMLLKAGALGRLHRIEVFEGGPFTWPVASPNYFNPELGAGGVFSDIGSHVLDLLHWWLGAPELVDYEDDAMGGVAANCRLALAFGETSAAIRLSRDWHRPNEVRIYGEHGSICWRTEEEDELTVDIPEGMQARVLLSEARKIEDANPLGSFEQAFTDQLTGVIASLSGKSGGYVGGEELLPVLKLIDRCREVRRTMEMPWLA
jgi:predicted dehydrogenase